MVCTDCLVATSTSRSMAMQEDLDSTDRINRDLKDDLRKKVLAMEEFRDFLMEFHSLFGEGSELFSIVDSPNDSDDCSRMEIQTLMKRCKSEFVNLKSLIVDAIGERENALKQAEYHRNVATQMQNQLNTLLLECKLMQTESRQLKDRLLHLEHDQQQLADLQHDNAELLMRCEKLSQVNLGQSIQSFARQSPATNSYTVPLCRRIINRICCCSLFN
ncbi:hypothetical protein BdWA1_002971 [Babesia duncani]|uniref:Uncharacterized protein n=1 Tax=Babesia duncani TaxID=323732 RepID=A0AAD9PJ16_9APIC|nr:hypothetical protein BdWA1_002971 [Babesia duncani]